MSSSENVSIYSVTVCVCVCVCNRECVCVCVRKHTVCVCVHVYVCIDTDRISKCNYKVLDSVCVWVRACLMYSLYIDSPVISNIYDGRSH